jgi:hypothetical protein
LRVPVRARRAIEPTAVLCRASVRAIASNTKGTATAGVAQAIRTGAVGVVGRIPRAIEGAVEGTAAACGMAVLAAGIAARRTQGGTRQRRSNSDTSGAGRIIGRRRKTGRRERRCDRSDRGRIDERRCERGAAYLCEPDRRLTPRVAALGGDRRLIEEAALPQRIDRALHVRRRKRKLFRHLRKRQLAVAAPPHRGCVARQAVRRLAQLVVYDQLVVDPLRDDAVSSCHRSIVDHGSKPAVRLTNPHQRHNRPVQKTHHACSTTSSSGRASATAVRISASIAGTPSAGAAAMVPSMPTRTAEGVARSR